MSLSLRLYIHPEPGGFALARRGAIKVWTRASEATLRARLESLEAPAPEAFAEFGLHLDETGALAGLTVEKSSGKASADAFWLDALKSVQGFAPPPVAVRDGQVVLQLEYVVDRSAVA